MPRTITKHRNSFTRPNSVTYTFPASVYKSNVVTIQIPPGSQWTSGLHFHSTHTEYLEVIQGSALITLNGQTSTYTPSQGIINIPRYTRHSWQRASPDGEDLIVREWTDPEDGQKEVFFRNLNSVIEEWVNEGGENEWWLNLQIWMLFWEMDNWPVFWDFGGVPVVGKWMEDVVTYSVLLFAVLIGSVMGLDNVYEEYTPDRLMQGKIESSGFKKKT